MSDEKLDLIIEELESGNEDVDFTQLSDPQAVNEAFLEEMAALAKEANLPLQTYISILMTHCGPLEMNEFKHEDTILKSKETITFYPCPAEGMHLEIKEEDNDFKVWVVGANVDDLKAKISEDLVSQWERYQKDEEHNLGENPEDMFEVVE